MSPICYIRRRLLHTSLLICSKNESNQVAVDLGKTIRRLNKENKALFGGLLETRKQKRKRASEFTISYDPQTVGKSDLSSELWWWKKNSPSKTVTLRVRWKDRDCQTEGSDPLSTRSNEILGDVRTEICKEDFPKEERGSCYNTGTKTGALEGNGSELNVNMKKHTTVITPTLPPIVIRQITSFPLRNNEKKHVYSSAIGEDLLQISVDEDGCRHRNFMSYPSVTKILSATMPESSRSALEKWRKKMIAQLGEEGFSSFQKGLLEQGSKFHAALQTFLSGSPESNLLLEPSIEGCWESVRPTLLNLTNVKVLESHVVHPSLKYRGVIDCVAQHCGKPVLIEWKKSDNKKPELAKTFDAPLQLCAYLGALNYDENYKLKVRGGLVVVAYTDGSPADTFKLNAADCNKYWRAWLVRLQQYWLQQNQGLTSSTSATSTRQ